MLQAWGLDHVQDALQLIEDIQVGKHDNVWKANCVSFADKPLGECAKDPKVVALLTPAMAKSRKATAVAPPVAVPAGDAVEEVAESVAIS